jgi:hypothetical protein
MNVAEERAWRRFRETVTSQGGRVLEEAWLGSHVRHRVICKNGHEVSPKPSLVRNGTRVCRVCSGADSATVAEAFRALMAERGWTILEPTWLGTKKRHRVICSQGHETTPMPASIMQKGTDCIVCAGKDQGTAWRHFCSQVVELGGVVLEPAPLGVNRGHRIRCPLGHETVSVPSYLRRGGGLCNICAPTSRIRAERRFRDLVERVGGVVLEPKWLGSNKPHRVRCPLGHESTPRPSDARQTGSICRVCAGHDSEVSWREFQDRVAQRGGTVLEPAWLGNKKRHRIVCGAGHPCAVLPNNVQQGNGICRICASKVWDIFYVVTSDELARVKFGITSGDARRRIRHHQSDGYGTVVRSITGLADAPDVESAVLATLRLAGLKPVLGREHFDISALEVVLDVVDNWPTVRALTTAQRP